MTICVLEGDMTECSMNLPRTIWFAWFQGMDNAPYVVQKCRESWEARNPGWRVVCLDSNTLPQYTSVDYSQGNIGRLLWQHRAGLLRLDLLANHGGVWVDATCFCVQPLNDWLPSNMNSGFFAFNRPMADRIISSWFLAAETGNVLMSRLFDEMLSYWRNHRLRTQQRRVIAEVLTRLLRISPATRRLWFSHPIRDWLAVGPYFAVSYGLEKLIHEDADCARVWRDTPKLSADGPHHLYQAGLLSPVSPDLRSEIARGEVPVYKLNWRLADQPIPDNSILRYLLENDSHTGLANHTRNQRPN